MVSCLFTLSCKVLSHVICLNQPLTVIETLAGCYGTLGLESGSVADSQLTASSVWKWNGVWAPTGARLKKAGLPWASLHSDQQQFLQVDRSQEGEENHRFLKQQL